LDARPRAITAQRTEGETAGLILTKKDDLENTGRGEEINAPLLGCNWLAADSVLYPWF
jgi:hypothetical protein